METEEILNKVTIKKIKKLSENLINDVNQSLDLPEGKSYSKVSFKIKSMEEYYEEDNAAGNAFIITDRVGEVKGKRTENGIYSPKYGSIWQDENAFKERYSCECGHLQGKMYENMECEQCGSEVIFKDKNIDITGYFYLTNYYVIHPTIFNLLKSLIGKKKLNAILYPNWETEGSGKPIKPVINENTKNINKYDSIGIIEFMNRFDEILEFFYKKKKRDDIYDLIKENRDKVFTKYLPVESTILRPFSIGEEDYYYDPINTQFTMLSCKVHDVNNKYLEMTEETEKILNMRLYAIQTRYAYIAAKISKGLNKKTGHIRSNIQGARYNNSGRYIISPMKTGKINEVDFPYLGFLEMYRPEIIHLLCKLNDLTINEAYILWKQATLQFNKRIYKIMDYMVKNYNIHILLNRNPTIAYGGIMRMRIRKIKKTYDDLTLCVPINSLGAFAGDFDGDALNTLSLKDAELSEAYELYDPRTHMIISKNDGLFDNSFNLIKDQLICLHQLCHLANTHKHTVKIVKKNKKKEKKKINMEAKKIIKINKLK